MSANVADEECCTFFDPVQWDEKSFDWQDRAFVRESIPLLFHMPFPPMIGRKIGKMWSLAEASKSTQSKEETLILFTDPTPFKSEIYLSVSGPVPKAENISLTGTFMSKVFDGPYNAIPKFVKSMDAYLEREGRKARKYYVHYAYCPKCAKRTGHNYMVMFAEV